MASAMESIYKGEVLNCIRNGKGTYRYPIGGNGLFLYDGPWVDGQKDGSQGKFTVKNSHQVTGDFKGGEISGNGVKTWSDGRRYEGEFLNGEMDGRGDWISGNGDETYIGTFKDNRRHGLGVLTLNKASSVYRGKFLSHKRHGFGTYNCRNTLNVEADFISNYINGKAKVLWRGVASLNGNCSSGLFEGSCHYTANDQSYEFNGPFLKGYPSPLFESSYVYLELDRSRLLAKVTEPEHHSNPGKKLLIPSSTKKGKPTEADVHLPQVLVGTEVGRITIRSGTQKDLEIEQLRLKEVAEATAAAAAAALALKPSKNARILIPTVEPELGDPTCPPPSAKYAVPSERRRNIIVRIRSVICAKNDSEILGSTMLKGTVKVVPTETKVLIPDSYGDTVPFWVRKLSQDEYGRQCGRFPSTSVAYIGGCRVPCATFDAEERDGEDADNEEKDLSEPNSASLACFEASTSATSKTAIKDQNDGDAVTSLYAPIMTLKVPYMEINHDASVTVAVDISLHESAIYDFFERRAREIGKDSTYITDGSSVEIPVFSITKLQIVRADHNSEGSTPPPELPHKTRNTATKSLQLVLIVPKKVITMATESRAITRAARAKELLSISKSEALKLQELALLEASTSSMLSPTKKKHAHAKKHANKESDHENSLKSPLRSTVVSMKEPVVEDDHYIWTDCVWELRVFETPPVAPIAIFTSEKHSNDGEVRAAFSGKESLTISYDGIGCEENVRMVYAQRWEGSIFSPSDWHSIALSARSPCHLESTTQDPCEVNLDEAFKGDEVGRKHSLELVLDGCGMKQRVTVGDDEACPLSEQSTESAVAEWLLSDQIDTEGYVGSAAEQGDGIVRSPQSPQTARTEETVRTYSTDDPKQTQAPNSPSPRVPVPALSFCVGGEGLLDRGQHGDEVCVLPFQGAVKAMAVMGGDGYNRVCEVTSCYAKWRAQEAGWAMLKKKEEEDIAAERIENQIICSDDFIEKSDDNTARSIGHSILSTIPADCAVVKEVVVSLQGGYGEIENILLPTDTPLRRYIIEVRDGVLPSCLRTPAPFADATTDPSTCDFTTISSPSVPTRASATLEEMKDLAAVVNPIRINRQIVFCAVTNAAHIP